MTVYAKYRKCRRERGYSDSVESRHELLCGVILTPDYSRVWGSVSHVWLWQSPWSKQQEGKKGAITKAR
jgi:hypothetical protein